MKRVFLALALVFRQPLTPRLMPRAMLMFLLCLLGITA